MHWPRPHVGIMRQRLQQQQQTQQQTQQQSVKRWELIEFSTAAENCKNLQSKVFPVSCLWLALLWLL